MGRDRWQRKDGRLPRLVLAVMAGALLLTVAAAPPLPASAPEDAAVPGGLDPAAQRGEMIRLLRSIDARLAELVEKTGR